MDNSFTQATASSATDIQAQMPRSPADTIAGPHGDLSTHAGSNDRREGVQAENGDAVGGTGTRRKRRRHPKGKGQQ
jgi:hypothetical protein